MYLEGSIRQFPNQWRIADEDDLVESAKVHSPAQHAQVLLAIGSIKSFDGFVPEQRFVPNTFSLPHVVDGDTQVYGFIVRIRYAWMTSATNHSRN